MLELMRSKIALSLLALAIVAGACTGARPPAEAPQPLPALPASAANPQRDPIVRVVEEVRPAVVNVTTEGFQQTQFGTQEGQGTGTGFIIRSDGVVVTNYHVVEGAQRIKVITTPPNSKQYEARVIGGDQTADLAVLKIGGQGHPTVPLGRSGQLALGQRVVAIGYALALEGGPSVTTGIVSALGRVVPDVQDPNCEECRTGPGGIGVRTYRDVIQTDAAINPGNSGGPLVDLSGRVIGINSAGVGASAAENIGFAISIDAVQPIIADAVANPGEPVAYFGIVSQDVTPSLAFQFDLPVREGAYIVDVARNGPAETAGIRAGDIVVEFDGGSIRGSEQLGVAITSGEPGDRVEVTYIDAGGNERTTSVTLDVNPLP